MKYMDRCRGWMFLFFSLVLVACAGEITQAPEPAPSQTLSPTATPAIPIGPLVLSPGELTAGQVTVAPTQPLYTEGEWVVGTVANGLDQTIYVQDQKTDCTIVILEHAADEGEAEPILGCGQERLTQTVVIEPGAGYRIVINPFSANLAFNASSELPVFGAGVYHLKFSYALQAAANENETSYSQNFVVIP